MKKILSLILAFVTLLPLAGCGTANTPISNSKPIAVEELSVPTFEDNKKIIITTEMPPDYSIKENLVQVKNSGMNTIILGEDYCLFGSEGFKNTMKWCEELGIDVIIRSTERNMPYPDYDAFDKDGIWPSNEPCYFERAEHLKNLNFRDYPAVIGFFVTDEPSFKQLLELEKHYVPWFNNNYADDYIWMVNFTSSDNAYLQGHYNKVNPDDPNEKPKTVTYDEMITYYMNNILTKVKTKKRIHCIDTYPLQLKDGKEITSESWLQVNLNAATYSKNVDAHFASCIQAFEGYGATRIPESTADIDFLNYVNLAFGSKFLLYYGYKETSEGDNYYPMMTEGGKEQPLYYYVQESNAKISKYDHVIMHYDKWDGIYTFVGTGNKTPEEESFNRLNTPQPSLTETAKANYLNALSGVSAFKSKYNCITGQLADADGNKGYILVNYDNRTLTRTNQVKITFENADGVLLYRDGEPEVIGLANHVFEIELKNREGVFIIPLNRK